jgi:hypothetical protein
MAAMMIKAALSWYGIISEIIYAPRSSSTCPVTFAVTEHRKTGQVS